MAKRLLQSHVVLEKLCLKTHLNNPGEETVGQVSIDEFELERGRFLVVGGKFGNDSSEFSRASAHSDGKKIREIQNQINLP